MKITDRFKSESHNVFTEEVNNISLSSIDDKRMQSINSIEICVWKKQKDLASKKEQIKCNSIKKRNKK